MCEHGSQSYGVGNYVHKGEGFNGAGLSETVALRDFQRCLAVLVGLPADSTAQLGSLGQTTTLAAAVASSQPFDGHGA